MQLSQGFLVLPVALGQYAHTKFTIPFILPLRLLAMRHAHLGCQQVGKHVTLTVSTSTKTLKADKTPILAV